MSKGRSSGIHKRRLDVTSVVDLWPASFQPIVDGSRRRLGSDSFAPDRTNAGCKLSTYVTRFWWNVTCAVLHWASQFHPSHVPSPAFYRYESRCSYMCFFGFLLTFSKANPWIVAHVALFIFLRIFSISFLSFLCSVGIFSEFDLHICTVFRAFNLLKCLTLCTCVRRRYSIFYFLFFLVLKLE